MTAKGIFPIDEWKPAPDRLELQPHEVHIWRSRLNVAGPMATSLAGCLSADELDRASRFRSAKDSDRFIARRVIQRIILGRYLKLEPAQLRFRHNEQGKPELDPAMASEPLCFNTSHSNGLAVFAISRNRTVGIDVEQVDPTTGWLEIAEHSFATREVDVLRKLPVSDRVAAFFSMWTCKEATMKAEGKGLSIPPDQVEVSLADDGSIALLSIDGNHDAAAAWSLRRFVPADGWLGAVCARGDGWQLQCWNWDSNSNAAGGAD